MAPTLFGQMSAFLQHRLLSQAPVRHFPNGQLIQQRGDVPSGFWFIEKGKVQIGMFGLKGEFRAIALLSDGDSYGELAVFAANRRAVDAVALGPVTMRWIEARGFEEAILSDPSSMRAMIGALSKQLQEMLGVIASLSNGSATTRVAAMLASLAGGLAGGRNAEHGTPAIVTLGQQALAELTGLTRATVSKCLSELEQQGAVKRGYGQIEILDYAAVRRAAIT